MQHPIHLQELNPSSGGLVWWVFDEVGGCGGGGGNRQLLGCRREVKVAVVGAINNNKNQPMKLH